MVDRLTRLVCGVRDEELLASGIGLPKPPGPTDGVPLMALDVRWLLRLGLRDVEVPRIHDRFAAGGQAIVDSLRLWPEQGPP